MLEAVHAPAAGLDRIVATLLFAAKSMRGVVVNAAPLSTADAPADFAMPELAAATGNVIVNVVAFDVPLAITIVQMQVLPISVYLANVTAGPAEKPVKVGVHACHTPIDCVTMLILLKI